MAETATLDNIFLLYSIRFMLKAYNYVLTFVIDYENSDRKKEKYWAEWYIIAYDLIHLNQ